MLQIGKFIQTEINSGELQSFDFCSQVCDKPGTELDSRVASGVAYWPKKWKQHFCIYLEVKISTLGDIENYPRMLQKDVLNYKWNLENCPELPRFDFRL